MQPLTELGRYMQLQYELEQTGTSAMSTALEWRNRGRLKQTVKDPWQNKWINANRRRIAASLRVQPPSEPSFDIQLTVFSHGDPFWTGASVPVLFDSGDRSRLVVDDRVEALERAAALNVDKLPEGMSANDQRVQVTLAHTQEWQARLGALGARSMTDAVDAPIPPPDAAAAVPSAAADPVAQLQQLEKLHSSGALSDDEYATARAQIIDSV